MKKKFTAAAAVRHEDPDRYYTKNDHLFVLTGPSGTGKHVIAAMLEEQGIAGYEITLDLKDGVEGIKTAVDSPAVTEILRSIIPEGHMTVIYINAPYERRYSRMAHHERKAPADIRRINCFDNAVYQSCRVDWIVNAQDTLEETAELVKQIIKSTRG
jgi:hypothetical protein